MKRKSILALAAAMMLAVSIPMFALAESDPAVQPLDGTGNMYGRSQSAAATATLPGDRLQLQDCELGEDCDCDAEGIGLGNDGEALHQYARSGGRGMMQSGNGTFADNCAYTTGSTATTVRNGRGMSTSAPQTTQTTQGGRGGRRTN